MTRRPRPLNIEQLEDRDLPSATVWGIPWPDGQHLTLSLAPDGTNISGVSSSLSQVLAEAGSGSELALLQAFQTWADYANINYGLVADGGEAFGIGKAIQDDPRFGDIRIGAIPLDSDTVAVTSPFDYFNTYSGNVVHQWQLSRSAQLIICTPSRCTRRDTLWVCPITTIPTR